MPVLVLLMPVLVLLLLFVLLCVKRNGLQRNKLPSGLEAITTTGSLRRIRLFRGATRASLSPKSECGAGLYEDLLPSIPTLALCDKPSPHDAAKSPCTMHSHFVTYEAVDSTCR
jgi:hypothetical protein